MDHLQDIDQGDILGEFGSNAPAPIQNRQTNMQSNETMTDRLPELTGTRSRVKVSREMFSVSVVDGKASVAVDGKTCCFNFGS
jgi:surfactin synthase thioesterase subunit